jgi:hypothetical protein
VLIRELISEKQVWAKSGKKVVRKYRCSSKIAQCFAAPDIKKRTKMKITRARLGKKMARKAKFTKKRNPVSKRVAALNKSRR